MGKVSNHAELSRTLRKALGGITQAELAAKLLISRNYVSQIEAELKTPSPRLVAQMDALLTSSVNRVSTPAQRAFEADEEDEFGPHQRRHLKSGGFEQPPPDASAGKLEGVASRIPQEQRRPADRGQCEAYFASLMERAELSEDPNAWPVILHRLKKEFPLHEWEQEPPEEKQ